VTRALPELCPVHIFAGFLGSGKTTLLRRVLQDPEFADTAVIINELGAVGLDHQLVRYAADRIIVLPGGCICCTVREDLEQCLQELFGARDAGTIPAFRRLIIETTGIADPQPLIFTLYTSPLSTSRLCKPQVTTVVDGVLGATTLVNHAEAAAQIVAADTIIVSKRDLGPVDAVLKSLTALNPWASVHAADLLADDLGAVFADVAREIPVLTDDSVAQHLIQSPGRETTNHGDVRSLCLVLPQQLDWGGFGVWMSMLLHCHGEKILRSKGLLNIEGAKGPVVFQCAQHLVHPPEHWDTWPTPDHRSKLVLIVRGLEPADLLRSLEAFDAVAKGMASVPVTEGYLPAGGGGSVAGRPIRRPTAPRWIKG
jgi:G3E family GTPase